jgi:uncharacterized protein YjbJ (UPF0337 family)
MNRDMIEGNWKQLKGKFQEEWGRLTEDNLDMVAGRRDQVIGKIQEIYGMTKDQAEKQIQDYEGRNSERRRRRAASDAAIRACRLRCR